MGSNRSRFIIAILICIVLSSSCVSASARGEKPGVESPIGPANRTEAVTGGYTQIDITADRAKIALEVLVEHLGKEGIVLEEPYEVWQQVVSGYKIRINCFFTQNGVEGILSGVVYISPDGETEIIDIQMSDG